MFTLSTRVVLLAAETATTDPLGLLTLIGVGGLLAAVVYLWQRDTAKQRDKAMDQLAELVVAIRDVNSSVKESTEAHKASREAYEELTEMMFPRGPKGRAPRSGT